MKIENFKEICTSEHKFQEHLRNSLIYPSISRFANRFVFVPFQITIDHSGKLLGIEISKRQHHLNNGYTRSTKAKFLKPASLVLESFNQWVPDQVGGNYQITKRDVNIRFQYHKRRNKEHNFVLNPTFAATYPILSRTYERLILNKYGCDGMGDILAIVDENGVIQNIECLHVQGKTNCGIVTRELLGLGNWNPAMQKGKAVKTQISLTIHV